MAYAVAGLATASGGAISAEGEIHISGNVAIKLTGNAQASLPLSNGASLVFQNIGSGSTFWQHFYFTIKGAISGSARETPFGHWLFNLPEGENVSAGQFYSVAGNPDHGVVFRFFSDGYFEPYYETRGFIGFRFDTGKGKQYGWAKIQTATPNPNNNRAHEFIKEYAWGDPGDKVHVGQRRLDEDEAHVAPQAANQSEATPPVDSQGSLGLLALGAVGLQAWRRSRRGDEHGA
jgi:hypothetical protein